MNRHRVLSVKVLKGAGHGFKVTQHPCRVAAPQSDGHPTPRGSSPRRCCAGPPRPFPPAHRAGPMSRQQVHGTQTSYSDARNQSSSFSTSMACLSRAPKRPPFFAHAQFRQNCNGQESPLHTTRSEQRLANHVSRGRTPRLRPGKCFWLPSDRSAAAEPERRRQRLALLRGALLGIIQRIVGGLPRRLKLSERCPEGLAKEPEKTPADRILELHGARHAAECSICDRP